MSNKRRFLEVQLKNLRTELVEARELQVKAQTEVEFCNKNVDVIIQKIMELEVEFDKVE